MRVLLVKRQKIFLMWILVYKLTLYAQYFDGQSSLKEEVRIEFFEDGGVKVKGEVLEIVTSINELSFSERVGNIPRNIIFSNGAIAQSNENDKIDQLLKKHKKSFSIVHVMESKMRYAILSFVMLILSVVFFFTIGSGIVAKGITAMLPEVVEKKIGQEAFAIMDKYILKDTLLSKEKQQEISDRFLYLNDDNSSHLHFRRGIGINAFALPSGDIVISDELIKFSDGDMDMIYGVLAHEKGHVVHKHSMQLIVKASAVSAIIAYFTGDISSLVASLSTSMLNANYTREFEREADEYAKIKMLKSGISPTHLADFFIKMSKGQSSLDGHGYFDSHPSNDERIKNLL